MELLNTRELVNASGVSSRTLRHYEAEGLLLPVGRDRMGQRLYGPEQLLRLQQIVAMRGLGLGLPVIRGVLARERELSESLAHRIEELSKERSRISDQIASLELTLERLEKGEPLVASEMFEGFQNDPYAAEAEQRWPNQYAESQRRLKSMSKAEQQALFDAGNQTHVELAKLFTAGAEFADAEVQTLIAKHYAWVNAFWTPDRTAYIALGEMYVADSRFAANYEKLAPGLAAFMRDSMRVWAEANLS